MNKLLNEQSSLILKVLKSLDFNSFLYTKSLVDSLLKEHKYEEAYHVLHTFNLNKNEEEYSNKLKTILYLKSLCIPHLKIEIEKKNNPLRKTPNIIITTTTCKRLPLFIRTVDSFITYCLDLNCVSEWIVIDDNSSEEDRKIMKERYPFMTFLYNNTKGHANSMNILFDKYYSNKDIDYIFHLEDDWEFFYPDTYISKCFHVLKQSENIGQCLLNKNYAEDHTQYDTAGGLERDYDGNVYYEHEYCKDEKEMIEFYKKYGSNCKHCAYWPGYSLRVGLIKRSVYDKLGKYNINADHFEKEFAERYYKANYKTCFLNEIACIHIGKKTYEKDKENAYTLNDEKQFGNKTVVDVLKKTLNKKIPTISEFKKQVQEFTKKELKIQITVLNLERRNDRKEKFIKENDTELSSMGYSFIHGVDGKTIKTNLKLLKLFETGDYNYRRGIIGTAYSYILLAIKLLSTDLDLIVNLEDDAKVCKNFTSVLTNILNNTNINDIDFMYLGHFLYPKYENKELYELKDNIRIDKWSNEKCLTESMGGLYGVIMTRSGAYKLLKHINKYGMTNAIDTVIYKSDTNKAFVTPHIVYSKCVMPNSVVDSDIQYDFNSLGIEPVDRILYDIKNWMTELDCKTINNKTNIECLSEKFEQDEKSPILISESLPTKDELLSSVSFIILNIKESNLESMLEQVNNYNKTANVLYTYTQKNYLLVIVPETKVNNNVLKQYTFNGDYLNLVNPL